MFHFKVSVSKNLLLVLSEDILCLFAKKESFFLHVFLKYH